MCQSVLSYEAHRNYFHHIDFRVIYADFKEGRELTNRQMEVVKATKDLMTGNEMGRRALASGMRKEDITFQLDASRSLEDLINFVETKLRRFNAREQKS